MPTPPESATALPASPLHKRNGASGASPYVLYSSEASTSQTSKEATQPDFDQDMVEWILHASESFHFRIFVTELLCQFLYQFIGPFGIPILWKMYGGRIGLQNRGFWPDRIIFIVQLLVSLPCTVAVYVFFRYQPEDIGTVEIKFLIFMSILRNSTIAIKYACMSTEAWSLINTQVFTYAYMSSFQIATVWLFCTRLAAEFYAEVSFVGILGSKTTRSNLKLKFVPWSREHDHLSDIQGRMDVTTKRLVHHPTEILSPSSRFRKVKKVKSNSDDQSSIVPGGSFDGMQKSHSGPDKVSSLSSNFPTQHRSGIQAKKRNVVQALGSNSLKDPEIYEQRVEKLAGKDLPNSQVLDREVVETAAVGGSVPIESLFLYFLRGLISSESAHLPPSGVKAILFTIGGVCILSPCLARLVGGGYVFGQSIEAQVYTFCALIANFIPFLTSIMFISAGAKDFWRRRALLRSCAALLTLQRYYRRGCPAEVDLLPILDMSDPHTIEGWRKLRQLCVDWGKVFLSRIQAFAAVYLLGSFIMAADFIASLELNAYMEISRVNLISFAMSCMILFTVFVCLVALVLLGNEINHSAERHAFLIQRQRLVLASRQHRMAFTKTAPSKQELVQDDILSRASDFLDVLSQDLLAEHLANPLKLLGATCGYQLLAGMYFIPASILASIAKFCTSDETYHRCQRSLGNL